MSRRIHVLQKLKPAFSEMPLQRNISQFDEHKRGDTNERKTGIYITTTEYCVFTSGKFASFYSTKLVVSELNNHGCLVIKSMNVTDVLVL